MGSLICNVMSSGTCPKPMSIHNVSIDILTYYNDYDDILNIYLLMTYVM